MAAVSDTAMLLYYDIDGDPADHDDWHTYEHMHERLSIAGFLRGTRWSAKSGQPRYLVLYEVSGIEVATSAAYLARLNAPTAWTAAMMGRFRGMVRGFGNVVASSGFGLGRAALSVRFSPKPGAESEMLGWLAQGVIPRVSSRRGISSACLFRPSAKPPMTKEQSIRGPDADMTWVLLATGYDVGALESLSEDELGLQAFERHGSGRTVEKGIYRLDFTLSAQEAARSAPNPPLPPGAR